MIADAEDGGGGVTQEQLDEIDSFLDLVRDEFDEIRESSQEAIDNAVAAQNSSGEQGNQGGEGGQGGQGDGTQTDPITDPVTEPDSSSGGGSAGEPVPAGN